MPGICGSHSPTDNITFSLNDIICPNRVHRTWAGTFKCHPEKYLQPSNIEEIIQIVKLARHNEKTVMVTGSGHSPSTLTMTDSWMINLDKFDRVVKVDRHPSGVYADVTVEAGIRIFQLNKCLDSMGLALQNLGSISEQSAAGLISTGTHGSSAFHGLMSQQVVDLSLVTGSGELITCSSNENQDLFRAALLSLGKVGIITHMTFRTVAAFNLKTVLEVITFDDFISRWSQVWTSSEFITCWWFPYSKNVILRTLDKTKEPCTASRYSFYGTYLGRLIYQSLLFLSVKIAPRLTPWVERWLFKRQYGVPSSNRSISVQSSVDSLNMDCLYSQFVNEWSVPHSSGLQILANLEKAIDRAAATGEYFVHAPIEIRISNTTVPETPLPTSLDLSLYNVDNFGAVPGNMVRPLLDTTPRLPYTESSEDIESSNLTLYINATMFRPFGFNSSIGKWYREFESIVNSEGFPHWAKNFIGTDDNSDKVSTKDADMIGIKHKVEQYLGSDLELFKRLTREHDPDGVFLSGKHWAQINGITD